MACATRRTGYRGAVARHAAHAGTGELRSLCRPEEPGLSAVEEGRAAAGGFGLFHQCAPACARGALETARRENPTAHHRGDSGPAQSTPALYQLAVIRRTQ